MTDLEKATVLFYIKAFLNKTQAEVDKLSGKGQPYTVELVGPVFDRKKLGYDVVLTARIRKKKAKPKGEN